MKKSMLLFAVLLLVLTGCTKPVVDIGEITDEVSGIVSEAEIVTLSKTIYEGSDIFIEYSGINIADCKVSIVSEWGEPITLDNSSISGADLYECKITNKLKPGKYYITLVTSSLKSNTIEITVLTVNKTPYISAVKDESSSVKIYGNSFIKGYAPVVMCDGKTAELKSFSDTCIEITKLSAGNHIIQVIAGEVKSNTVLVKTE